MPLPRNTWIIRGCTACGGDLYRQTADDDFPDHFACLQCGRRVPPRMAVLDHVDPRALIRPQADRA